MNYTQKHILDLTHRLTDHLLYEDQNGCQSVIDESLKYGLTPLSIFHSIITNALNEIGARWHSGDITIANEHRAIQLANELIDIVAMKTPKLAANGYRAVVSSVEGENHIVGAKMFAKILDLNGWMVHFLGPDMPAGDLAIYTADQQANVVALSLKQPSNIDKLKDCIRELNNLPAPPTVLIGGPVASNIRNELKDILVASDCVSGLEILEQHLGVKHNDNSLENILSHIGKRVKEIRKTRNINQVDLANSAGVDRAYVSLVENGKQNLTMAVLFKLSEALGVPISALISK